MKYLLLSFSFLLSFNGFSQDAEFIHTYEYGGGENILDIQQTADNGFVAVGVHTLGIGASRVMLIKTDSLGEEEWHRFYGFPYSNSGRKIRITPEGDFLILARTSGDTIVATAENTYIIKTNPQGDTLWTRVFGGDTYPDIGFDLEITPEGEYLIGGIYRSSSLTGESNINLIKLDANGNVIYNKILDYSGNQTLLALELSENGDMIAGGAIEYNEGFADIYVMKLDEGGDTIWTTSLEWEFVDIVNNLIESSDGNILVTGITSSFRDNVGYDVFFIMLNSQGEILWTKLVGENLNDSSENVKDLIALDNDEFVWLGRNVYSGGNDIQLQKINAVGEIIWDRRFSEFETGFEANNLLVKKNGDFVLGGTMDFENTECSVCGAIVMTNEEGLATDVKDKIVELESINIFPNPSDNGNFTITIDAKITKKINIELYNSIGQTIFQKSENLIYGKNNISIALTSIPIGHYYLKISDSFGKVESHVLLIQ